MAYTEASKKATIKYMQENLEEIRFRVKKGKKEEIKQKASEKGVSMTAYILELIEKDLKE